MCILSSGGKASEILGKSSLRASDVDMLSNHIADETDHISVRSIDIEAALNASFHIVLDGQVFGPFARVRITPCHALGAEEPLHLPLMHHLPVSLM